MLLAAELPSLGEAIIGGVASVVALIASYGIAILARSLAARFKMDLTSRQEGLIRAAAYRIVLGIEQKAAGALKLGKKVDSGIAKKFLAARRLAKKFPSLDEDEVDSLVESSVHILREEADFLRKASEAAVE